MGTGFCGRPSAGVSRVTGRVRDASPRVKAGTTPKPLAGAYAMGHGALTV